MTIWALKNPTDEKDIDFVYNSIKQGVSRFGWSADSECDLKRLDPLPWSALTTNQIDCFKKAKFLLEVEPGDWIVHINIPSYGRCIAAQIVAGYEFDRSELDDFRHTLKIDTNTVIEFDRNDANVLPVTSSRLKLQGGFWRISQQEAFKESIENLRSGKVVLKNNERAETYHLRNSIKPLLKSFTDSIQLNNPSHHFESFLAEIFRKMPNVTEVIEHGKHKGYKTDHGADIIVYYNLGLPIEGLQRSSILVVQAKSYTDIHWETNAVDQLKTAMDEFNADSGILFTTAEPSDNLIKKFDLVSTKFTEKGKVILLISGEDVARFALKFGADIILSAQK